MIIDLSRPIRSGMPVYPGDTETVLEQSKFFRQDQYNNHQLSMNMHAGTHIDGPMHLLDRDVYLNMFPIETFFGEGCLIDAEGQGVIDCRPEYESVLKPGQIVLIHTGHGKYYGSPEYFNTHPVLTADFADLLVRKHIKWVGLDSPSPDHYPFEVHKHLFRHDILIAENLTRLDELKGVRSFEVMALPLPVDADSAPARVAARINA